MAVVSTDSWPSQRAITERSTPWCSSSVARVWCYMGCHALGGQGWTVATGDGEVLVQHVLECVMAERRAAYRRKDNVGRPALTLGIAGFGSRR
jgi:hypothetical protein